MKKLFFALLVCSATLVACKKEGCTNPLATNYDKKAKKDDGSCILTQDPNTAPLCAGITGNTKLLPIAAGYKWEYRRTTGGQASLYSEEIVGTEDINGISYFKVHFVNNQISSTGTFHLRVDASNGNVYKKPDGQEEVLYISGNPTVGQSIGAGTVTNVNASITTAACTYTGCVEVTESSTLATKKLYFKRGIGVVKVDNGVLGVDELDGVAF